MVLFYMIFCLSVMDDGYFRDSSPEMALVTGSLSTTISFIFGLNSLIRAGAVFEMKYAGLFSIVMSPSPDVGICDLEIYFDHLFSPRIEAVNLLITLCLSHQD